MTDHSITVAICTHDRVSDVELCLSKLAPQARCADVRVLLLDSASSKEAAERLRFVSAKYGAQYIRVNRAGLSLARNTAYENSNTEWLTFIDDDAVPDEHWVAAMQQVLASVNPNVALVGGRIDPIWPEGIPPAGITEAWLMLLSCVQRADRGPARAGFNICGANFSVRRDALGKAGLFPTSLGREGKKLLSGEESFLIARLEEMGYEALYDGSFIVGHRIPKERMQIDWAKRRAYWEGVSVVRIMRELGRPVPAYLSLFKLAGSLPVLKLWSLVSRSAEPHLRYQMALGSLLGRLGRE